MQISIADICINFIHKYIFVKLSPEKLVNYIGIIGYSFVPSVLTQLANAVLLEKDAQFYIWEKTFTKCPKRFTVYF